MLAAINVTVRAMVRERRSNMIGKVRLLVGRER